MSLFLLACAGLLLLSGVFYLFPRKRELDADNELTRSNLEWYRLREAELADEVDEALREDARLRLLEDEHQQSSADRSATASSSFPLWLLPLVVIALSVGLYYKLGAAPDVLISRQLQRMGEAATPAEMEALMQAVERRSSQRPDNLHYVALLGRFYMGRQDYARAAATYTALTKEAPEDAQALAYAAQAEYLARNRELTPQAQMLAEQSLAIDPHQRTALGLLGMASFEKGEYRGAIEYWQRLLATEQPGTESANMIAGVIETARQRLGEAAPAAPARQPAAPAELASAGVTVRVVAPEGASIAPSDTVFVLARNALSESRMPVAVQRLSGAQLPMTLRLDDSSSMAGQKLSELESIVVVVQVSPEGRPGEATATWLGSAGPLVPSLEGEPLEIKLTPKS